MKAHPEHKHLKTVIILGVMMKRYGFLLRRMMSELYFRRGSRKAAGLKHVPSKSWLHKWLKRAPMDLLDGLILLTAGKAAYGSFLMDSNPRHRFNRYAMVDHARGKRWVTDTRKRHVLVSPDGKVLVSVVTDGNGADTTMFGKLCAKIPDGSGAALGGRRLLLLGPAARRPRPKAEARTLNPRRTMPARGPATGPRWSSCSGRIRAGSTESTMPGPR